MKKFFFSAVLALCAFVASQAQSCDYYVANADPIDVWDWKMDDAGPFPAVTELGILPGQLRTGSIPVFFAFPLSWKAQDSNGCGISQTAFGPTPVITAPSSCATANAIYQVGTIIPFVQYYIKIQLN